MSWYDNVFLASPEDDVEPIMEVGIYEIYHNGVDYEVSVDLIESDASIKDTYIEAIYRWEEDGETKVECSDEMTDEDYDDIAEKILEINKNDKASY